MLTPITPPLPIQPPGGMGHPQEIKGSEGPVQSDQSEPDWWGEEGGKGGSVLELGGGEREQLLSPNLAVPPPATTTPRCHHMTSPIPGGPQGGETEAQRAGERALLWGRHKEGGVRSQKATPGIQSTPNLLSALGGGGKGAESLEGQGMLRGGSTP